MVKLLKNDNVKVVLVVIAFVATACFLVPLAINLFFKGLLFIMEEPVTALLVSGSFTLGMIANELLSKADETISK
jgi:hypothetical protein